MMSWKRNALYYNYTTIVYAKLFKFIYSINMHITNQENMQLAH